jgi:hypothetical protein
VRRWRGGGGRAWRWRGGEREGEEKARGIGGRTGDPAAQQAKAIESSKGKLALGPWLLDRSSLYLPRMIVCVRCRDKPKSNQIYTWGLQPAQHILLVLILPPSVCLTPYVLLFFHATDSAKLAALIDLVRFLSP